MRDADLVSTAIPFNIQIGPEYNKYTNNGA